MSRRTTPPFRADHVGSLLRPPDAARRRATTSPPAGSTPTSCAPSRTTAIRDVVRMQEDVGLQSATDGEFRRASWHMDFIYQLDGITKDAGRHRGPVPQRPTATSSSRRPRCTSTASSASRQTIFGDDFAFLRDTVTTRRAEADDPVAEHGPLPRRPGGDRRERLPRPRRVLGRPHRRLPRGGAPARRARLHATCSSTTRASPTSTTRSSASTSRRSAATPSTSTSSTSATSTRRSPSRPDGHARHDAHVPRQLPLVVGRRGRLRLRRRGAVQRARGRRLLHGVGRRALGRLRAAALRAARASWSCSAS